ncbi:MULTISPECIES: hypothetical protein [Legionella]|uniref:hypothetical protein n=1 Tax=Legionella TaxID=445 RepID=UPI001E5EAA97|nr:MULTISPECIES: hypothetical protein [Legionella]MCC5016033.1 hypothetical protein [Legionella sp. 31fI33]
MKLLQCEHQEACTRITVLGIAKAAQSDLVKGITVANETKGIIIIMPARHFIIFFIFSTLNFEESTTSSSGQQVSDTKLELEYSQ